MVPRLFILYVLSSVIITSAYSQDSLQVSYFNYKFESAPVTAAIYYGIVLPVTKSLFVATLYNAEHTRIAAVTYTNKNLDKKEGPVTGFHKSGSIQFSGNYADNMLDGVWKSWYPGKQLCDSGMLQKDVPEGIWKSWYPNGQLRFEANFNARQLKKTKNNLEQLYIAPFRRIDADDKNYNNRSSSSMTYRKMMFSDVSATLQPSGIVGEGFLLPLKFKCDLNDNSGFETYNPPFTECLVHGQFKSYFPDGSLKDSGYYKNGIRSGIWIEWNTENAGKAMGFYRKGKKHKDWRFYNQQGKLVCIKRYNRAGENIETINLD